MIAGWCVTFGVARAPRRANVGSLAAREVATAYLNTRPMAERMRRASSSLPSVSNGFTVLSTSAAVMDAMGKEPNAAFARSSRR